MGEGTRAFSGLSNWHPGDVAVVVHGAWGISLDEEDTRVQAREVSESLERLGMTAPVVALGPDLTELRQIRQYRPKLIFNLVEGLGGLGRRAHEAAVVLEQVGVPLTGVSGAVQEVVNSKVACKEALVAAGLPTPLWTTTGTDVSGDGLWIVKPVWEHGSLAMDSGSVVFGSEVASALARRHADSPHLHFAEQYVTGREFNVSVVEGPGGGEVFPAVEMLFVDYPDQALRIVDYAAKWDSGSFGFNHTPRRFEFLEGDKPLLDRLQQLSLDVWRHFRMEGYVRVDFRVDERNQPWILEVNANPCLSHDAGFVVTVLKSGLEYDRLIARLVQAALGWPT
ncbi:MAG: D-alanine--D-alanine ligase [Magnetococcales bacterium]|nr:D-alanine--D-alanine ligase [Magnetococcales bacterium]HIJ85976.1 D-alanine--D-alanine ligase [Magnetococcales bacterium]